MASIGCLGEIVTAIDVGSSKIAVARAHVTSGHIDLIEMATAPSAGVRQGIVIDQQAAANALRLACTAVPQSSIGGVIVSFSGQHIHGMDSCGMAAVENERISPTDIDRARAAVLLAPISVADAVLGTIEQGFAVDGQKGVLCPIGMVGRRLEMLVHRIQVGSGAVGDLLAAMRKSGVDAKELVPQALAASQGALSEQEVAEGVCLMDIGAGTSDVAVFSGGTLRQLWTLPVAGNDITSDIANALHVGYSVAEDVKRKFGLAFAALADNTQPVDLGNEISVPVAQEELARIIKRRLENLLAQILKELDRSGLSLMLRHGLVITGGTANLPGLVELGEEIFHMPVRIGMPNRVGVAHGTVQMPEASAVVGALLGGFTSRQSTQAAA